MSKKKNEKKVFHGFRATAAEEISSQPNTATAVLLASSSTAECVVVKRESSSIQSDPVCRTEQSIFPISLPPIRRVLSLYISTYCAVFFLLSSSAPPTKENKVPFLFSPFKLMKVFFFLFRPTGTDLSKLREESGMRRVINANVYN